MKKKSNFHNLIRVFLALNMLTILLFSGCSCKQNEQPDEHPLDGDGEINYAAMPGVPEVPEQYGYAIYLKIRAEFVIYLNDRGGMITYEMKNNEAMKVAEHAAIMEGDCFEATREIFRMSIDDFSIDTENEDMQVALIVNNLSDEEGSEMLQRAIDGANAALEERNKTGEVKYSIPEGMVFTESAHHEDVPGDEGRPSEEDHPNYNKETDEWICASQSDLDSVIDFMRERGIEGVRSIKISKDLTLSLNSSSQYKDIALDCNGQKITIAGNFVVDTDNVQPLTLQNAGSVDLSGLNVDMDSARNLKPGGPRPEETEEQAYWNTQNSRVDIVRISGTPEGNIIIPELFEREDSVERSEKTDSIFDPYCVYETKPDEICLRVVGPADDYDARKEKETKVLEQLFANGEYHSMTGQTSNNFYYVCTDITMDIGECTLPNMDYDAISVGKGGHLTLTGTLYITGGTFKMETFQHDGIDIRGLTIVKKHPSPDMIHIGYDPAEGIDDDLYKCKTASGTIYYTKGSDKVAITVW